jgi:hypothetical protein
LPLTYIDYITDVTEDIKSLLDEMRCQPILFVGTGISRRYFGAPTWEELLKEMAMKCPLIDKDFAYYKQDARKDPDGNELIKIGTKFSHLYYEWAWGGGRNEFPTNLFSEDQTPEIYFKYKVAEHIDYRFREFINNPTDYSIKEELDLLKKIRPHALITTNYDLFLEHVFPEYEPIIGQKILRSNFTTYGEILKIHGCLSDPKGMVLIESDYNDFENKKKYLSAKLLTYFAEHPLLFIGYSAEDPNIKSILSDVDEIISSEGKVIPNIYILEWKPKVDDSEYPITEKIIFIERHRTVRVKCITASSFKWVYEAFLYTGEIEKVNVKILRSLLARTYELVRTDIPRKEIEVNYKTLENITNKEDGLATLYGISLLDNPKYLNFVYPYILTDIAVKLGYFTRKHHKGDWQKVDKLIDRGRLIRTSA